MEGAILRRRWPEVKRMDSIAAMQEFDGSFLVSRLRWT